ncbi:hypothetical protein Gorai_011548, partial [Gossypium raimondii]|nr:hypothetical protein [Gossypium raimondii]
MVREGNQLSVKVVNHVPNNITIHWLGVPYPFPKPYKEVPIIFGEWFNADTEAIISQALQTGAGPNVSDAYTINGHPGPFYNCSAKGTKRLVLQYDELIESFNSAGELIIYWQPTIFDFSKIF